MRASRPLRERDRRERALPLPIPEQHSGERLTVLLALLRCGTEELPLCFGEGRKVLPLVGPVWLSRAHERVSRASDAARQIYYSRGAMSPVS
jgi:hypothetical protein